MFFLLTFPKNVAWFSQLQEVHLTVKVLPQNSDHDSSVRLTLTGSLTTKLRCGGSPRSGKQIEN
jgi:hypothetical protein